MPWNTLEPSLQAATILGQRPFGGTFCSICRECDHVASGCALAPIQQQVYSRASPYDYSSARPPRRAESLHHICIAWNKGTCRRVACTFRHVCATCQLGHKARDCADTPPTSEYKRIKRGGGTT
jgi:hypothetical protein